MTGWISSFADVWLVIGHVAAALAANHTWPRTNWAGIFFKNGMIRTVSADNQLAAAAWLRRTPIADCGCGSCLAWISVKART